MPMFPSMRPEIVLMIYLLLQGRLRLWWLLSLVMFLPSSIYLIMVVISWKQMTKDILFSTMLLLQVRPHPETLTHTWTHNVCKLVIILLIIFFHIRVAQCCGRLTFRIIPFITGCCKVTEFLLSKGVPVDIDCGLGTPAYTASVNEQDKTLKILLDHHANVYCFHNLLFLLIQS